MTSQRDALSEQHGGIFYRVKFLPCSCPLLREVFFPSVVGNSIRNRQVAIQTNHADWWRIRNGSLFYPGPAKRIVSIVSIRKRLKLLFQNYFVQQARAKHR